MIKYTEEIILERDIACKRCGSEDLWKNGKENGDQYFRCKECDYRFKGFNTFPRYRYEKDIIFEAITNFYNGMSFGAIQNTFDELEKGFIAKSTLWTWVTRFTNAVIPYVKNLYPQVGDIWVADETMIMMHGRNKWLWACIDEQTRYLLGCHLSQSRGIKDATVLFREAHLHAGKKPLKIITDKLPAYHDAYKKVFWSRYLEDRPSHTQSAGFLSHTNQNLIERWHEYVKQRTKIMRHFKNTKSAKTILNGIIINYNYLWEHSTLGGIPPALKAGIDIHGLELYSWGDLIELAMDYNKITPNPSYTFFTDDMKRLRRG